MMTWRLWLVLALALAAPPAHAAHGGGTSRTPETMIARAWCDAHGGQTEVLTADGSRVDCLTPTHAIEVERARRWADALGQALAYQVQTGRRAGIVLVLERPADGRYWRRLRAVVETHRLPIDVWRVPDGDDPLGAATAHQ